MIMITTVQQTVYPLLLICSVFGLGIYSPKKLCLNIFYNLAVWTSYAWLCYYVVTALNAGVWYRSVSNTVHIRIGVLTIITSIIMSIYQYKKFKLFMKSLAVVDDTLEKIGTPKIYQKLHSYIKRMLFGWLVCSYVGNVFDMIGWFYAMKDHWCVIIPCITNHFHHMNMLMDLLLMTFLWYISTRFDKVNEHMRYLIVNKNEYRLNFSKKGTPSTRQYMCIDYKRLLWIAMHLHLKLYQIARELNTIFGPQMTMGMLAYMIYVARLCNYIYMHIQTKGRYIRSPVSWLGISFWVSIHLARLFSLNYICEKVSTKANEMETIIHQLTNSLQYTDVRNEIYQFSLQIIQRPLKFTGLDLFYFGNSLLRKFVIAITSFVVIIIQISDTNKTDMEF